MLSQISHKTHRLFKIPFKTLLAYHCPLGNTIKYWTSHLMIAHILGVRNDLTILNLGYTLIQIRKALNVVYSKIIGRGSLLIYARANKSQFIETDTVYTFVNMWIPGLISNYKRVITSIHKNVRALHNFGSIYLTRPQLDALDATRYHASLLPSNVKKVNRYRRFARIPNISLSVLDSFIWLNECESLAIPSIQLCDSQTFIDNVTYPIIANQRSVPFTRLIIGLFSEICAYALMSEHFYVKKMKLTSVNLRHLDPVHILAKTFKVQNLQFPKTSINAEPRVYNYYKKLMRFWHGFSKYLKREQYYILDDLAKGQIKKNLGNDSFAIKDFIQTTKKKNVYINKQLVLLTKCQTYLKNVKTQLRKYRKSILNFNEWYLRYSIIKNRLEKKRAKKVSDRKLRTYLTTIRKRYRRKLWKSKRSFARLIKYTRKKLRYYRYKSFVKNPIEVSHIKDQDSYNQDLGNYFIKSAGNQIHHHIKRRKRFIYNQNTYIFNKRFFSYNIRDRLLLK
jgi:ribosomal protein S2